MHEIAFPSGRVLHPDYPAAADLPRALLWWSQTGDDKAAEEQRLLVTAAVLDIVVPRHERTWPPPPPGTPWVEVGRCVLEVLAPEGPARVWSAALRAARELETWLYPPEAPASDAEGKDSALTSSSDASSAPPAGGPAAPDVGAS